MLRVLKRQKKLMANPSPKETCVGNLASKKEQLIGMKSGIGLKMKDSSLSKKLTLDVQNVIVPPKSKTSLVRKEISSSGESVTVPSSNVDGKLENLPGDGEKKPKHELENTHQEEGVARRPPTSPASRNVIESPSKKFQDSPSKKSIESDGSPHALENQSEHGGAMHIAESSMTGESKIVQKDPKKPFLMSGCKVVDSAGTMLVTGVGINTEWGLLMVSISENTGEETPLQVC